MRRFICKPSEDGKINKQLMHKVKLSVVVRLKAESGRFICNSLMFEILAPGRRKCWAISFQRAFYHWNSGNGTNIPGLYLLYQPEVTCQGNCMPFNSESSSMGWQVKPKRRKHQLCTTVRNILLLCTRIRPKRVYLFITVN